MSTERPVELPESQEPSEGPARKLRNYLIAGLLIWLPIMITVWVIRFVAHILDQSLVLIPPPWRPEALFGRYIPGVGVVLSLLLLLATGVLVRNLFGRQMVQGLENLVRRIPVVGQVYGGAKTFSETVLADKGRSFKQVVLVRFPYKDTYSIGFITAEKIEEIQAKTSEDVICVVVPHTPNPTGGFIVLVPKDEVIHLDMSVDEAVRLVLTMGVVVPTWRNKPTDPLLAPPETHP